MCSERIQRAFLPCVCCKLIAFENRSGVSGKVPLNFTWCCVISDNLRVLCGGWMLLTPLMKGDPLVFWLPAPSSSVYLWPQASHHCVRSVSGPRRQPSTEGCLSHIVSLLYFFSCLYIIWYLSVFSPAYKDLLKMKKAISVVCIVQELMEGFPGGPVAKTVLPMLGAWVRSLIRELDPTYRN